MNGSVLLSGLIIGGILNASPTQLFESKVSELVLSPCAASERCPCGHSVSPVKNCSPTENILLYLHTET